MGVDNLNEEKMNELLRMMSSVIPDESGMSDAGRIGFVTKGEYSDSEPYENLDVVLYGGSLWTPIKDTTGNPPPENQRNEDGSPASNEFWKLFLPGALGDDYVKKTDIAKAPTETESGKVGVVIPDGKTIQIDENGLLTGTPLDFMGTWKELQEGLASGEITEGMIGYIEGTPDNPEDPDHPNNILIHIDDYLSLVSSNAVQNRIITAALNQIKELAEQNAQIIEETKALRASIEAFGLSKVCPVETTDVTETDSGLVLGAFEKNASVAGSLGNKIETLNNKYTENIGKTKVVIKSYRSVSGSVVLDCFPNDGVTYIVICSASLDNAAEKLLFTSTIRNNGAASVNVIKQNYTTGYLEVAQTQENKIQATLKNISGSANINVQALIMPFWK